MTDWYWISILVIAFIALFLSGFTFVKFIRTKKPTFNLGFVMLYSFLFGVVLLWIYFGDIGSTLRKIERGERAQQNRPFEEKFEFRATGIWLICKYDETVDNPLPESYRLIPPKALKRRADEIKELYNYLQKGYSILWPLPEYHDPASLPLNKYYWIAFKKKGIYPDGDILTPKWFFRWLERDAGWSEISIRDPEEIYRAYPELKRL